MRIVNKKGEELSQPPNVPKAKPAGAAYSSCCAKEPHDDLIGSFIDEKCPRCGATLDMCSRHCRSKRRKRMFKTNEEWNDLEEWYDFTNPSEYPYRYLNEVLSDWNDERKKYLQSSNVANPVLCEVEAELDRAVSLFPPFNSLHEGYAVMLEEFDELWENVKINQKNRNPTEIKKECVQIAAMALRVIIDCSKVDFKK